MRCFKKWSEHKSKKRLKNQIIQYTLIFFAVVFLVIGCYLIIENYSKLARGYKSNKDTSVLVNSNNYDIIPEKSTIINNNSTYVSECFELYLLETFKFTKTKREVLDFTHTPKLPKSQLEEPFRYHIRPEIGEEIGELYIPKLDAVLPIFEGTSEDELELGVGHYADSVLPGENDNSVLAGHRDTVFRRLGEVGVGDSLIVRVQDKEFEYKVAKVRIVDKEDRTVIVPRPRATLTVSTCYPFSYIGAAPKRYVLIGYLVQ